MSQAVSDRDDSDNEGDYGGVDFAGGDDDLVGEAEPRPGVDAESLVGSGKGAVGELQLIPEPQKAQDMRINYAKVDKKIDVKSLKWNIWNELCGERVR
jgi:condensin complex subunit 2